jgi:hypothetical protein
MHHVSKWLAVWIKIVSHPSEQTISEVSQSPEARSKIAYLWIFLVGTLVAASSVVSYSAAAGARGNLTGLLIISPAIGGMLVLSFFSSILIKQWIAKHLGGTGTHSELAYTFSAIYTPFALVSSIFILLSASSSMWVFSEAAISLAFLYNLILQIKSVKVINGFGWKEAAISVLIPFAGVLVFCSFITPIGLTVTHWP